MQRGTSPVDAFLRSPSCTLTSMHIHMETKWTERDLEFRGHNRIGCHRQLEALSQRGQDQVDLQRGKIHANTSTRASAKGNEGKIRALSPDNVFVQKPFRKEAIRLLPMVRVPMEGINDQ